VTTYYVYRDRLGHYRWRLVHNSNGKTIADSGEGYVRKSDCLHGINIVKGSSLSPIYEL